MGGIRAYDGDNDGNGMKRDCCKTPKARLAISMVPRRCNAAHHLSIRATDSLTSISLAPVEPCNRLAGFCMRVRPQRFQDKSQRLFTWQRIQKAHFEIQLQMAHPYKNSAILFLPVLSLCSCLAGHLVRSLSWSISAIYLQVLLSCNR